MLERLAKPLAGMSLWVYSGWTQSAYELNLTLTPPKTTVAQQVYDLHTLILYVCLGIFVVVFGTMFIAILLHRKSRGRQPAQFHENTAVEIAWTLVAFVILVGMAYPATKTLLGMKDTSVPDLTIKVTGHQWKWSYDYLNEGIRYFSNLATPREQINNQTAKGEHYLLEVDRPLMVPVGKKIRLLLTANDVVHSWWVPALGVKQDAIPGFIRDTWFKVEEPGTYRGQCAELCGKDHAFMPIVVEAVELQQFALWVEEQKKEQTAVQAAAERVFALDELKIQGEKVFATNCAACHQPDGMGIPGTFPALNGSKIVNGPREVQIQLVLNGRPGTLMPSFGEQLSDADLAAVITYTRNAWDNHTGETIQPSEVKGLRGAPCPEGVGRCPR